MEINRKSRLIKEDNNYSLETANDEKILELADHSAFTVTGAGGDLNEWCAGMNEMLAEEGIGQVKTFYTWKGKQMNDLFELKGNVAYKDDITFLAFDLEGLDVGKLAMFKMQFGARWLDDIIMNNKMHMDFDESSDDLSFINMDKSSDGKFGVGDFITGDRCECGKIARIYKNKFGNERFEVHTLNGISIVDPKSAKLLSPEEVRKFLNKGE